MFVGRRNVDTALHVANGPELQRACDLIDEGEKPGVGEFVVTPSFGGFKTRASSIAHVVAPRMTEPIRNDLDKLESTEAKNFTLQLSNCYRGPLAYAKEQGLSSIAFPALACGVGNAPTSVSSKLGLQAAMRALQEEPGTLEEVVFACLERKDFVIFQKTAQALDLTHEGEDAA